MPTVQQAHDEFHRVRRLHDDYLETIGDVNGGGKALFLRHEISKAAPIGLYWHWKGTKDDHRVFVVTCCGIHEDTHIPIVLLTRLFGPEAGIPAFKDLIHSEQGFLKPIHRKTGPFPYVGPRCILMSSLTPLQALAIVEGASECAKHRSLAGVCQYIENNLAEVSITIP